MFSHSQIRIYFFQTCNDGKPSPPPLCDSLNHLLSEDLPKQALFFELYLPVLYPYRGTHGVQSNPVNILGKGVQMERRGQVRKDGKS